MYCRECKVKIRGNTPICPLCHENLSPHETEEIFPIANKPIKNGKNLFTKIYLFISLNLFIIFIFVNHFWIKNNMYILLAAAVLFYIYVLVRKTIMTGRNVGKKVLMQSIVIALLCLIIQWTFKTEEWCVTFAFPLINVIASIVLGVFTLVSVNSRREHLLYFLAIAVFGLLPLIIYYIKREDIEYVWPIIVSTMTSVAAITSLIIFAFKDLLIEIKKKFHI